MIKYSYILLDLDNTLLDFRAAEEYSFFHTGAQFGLEFTPADLSEYRLINDALWARLEHGELSKADVLSTRFAKLFEKMAVATNPEDFNRAYLDNLCLHTIPIAGAEEICKKIHPLATVIVATNGVSSTQHMRIEASGLGKYFHHVIVSDGAGAEKPSPIYFDHLFKLCDITDKNSCIIVGDSLVADIGGGIAAGIDSCYFNPKHRKNHSEIAPKYEISALSELEDILFTND